MIYAPIKYKKVNANSPLYLNCLSYRINSINIKKVHTSANTVFPIKQNTNNAIITPTIVAENANIGHREVIVDNTKKKTDSEIQPVCKQSAREKLNNFKTTFSRKFDAAFGQKLKSTREIVSAKFNKKSTKTESANSEDKVSRIEILKTKFDNFFNRENKNTETENDSNHYAKFKAKVNSFLDKCKNAKIDLKISSKKKKNAIKNDCTNYELDETLQAMALGIQNQPVDIDYTIKAMALGIQDFQPSTVKVDKTLGTIAKNLQEENEFIEVDQTLAALSAAAKVNVGEKKKADELARANKTKDNIVVEPSITEKTAHTEETLTTAGTPASALDDIAQIQETLLANGSFESKTTFSQRLSNGIAKLKNYFASKNRNETLDKQNGIEASQEIENSCNDINKEIISDDDNQKAEIVVEEKTKNVEIANSTTNLDEQICESTIDETTTSCEDVCEIPENVTPKRKSYYALKIENAKKHIINSGVRVKKAANKIVNAFKSTLATPEVVEYEDKDDYRKYGMKNVEIDPFFDTDSNLVVPEEMDNSTSILCKDSLELSIPPKGNVPTVLAQEKPKNYRFTTLDEYFEL